jgi:hypothetical protein
LVVTVGSPVVTAAASGGFPGGQAESSGEYNKQRVHPEIVVEELCVDDN